MTKIERRRRVVKLHQGNYEAELTALLDKAMAAQRAEASAESETDPDAPIAPRRVGQAAPVAQVKESIRLAAEYDALLTEAEESATEVTVWAIGHDEWADLSDEHPPRDDIPEDKEAGTAAKTFPKDKELGVNAKTFPPLLLKAALVEPDAATSLEDRLVRGGKILDDLGLSRIHYVKLENAAWNVNVGDDALPKFSLVSFLQEANAPESRQPLGPE